MEQGGASFLMFFSTCRALDAASLCDKSDISVNFLTQSMADAWKICIFALGEDRMRFGNAKSENFVFHLSLRSLFAIFERDKSDISVKNMT